MKPLVFLSFVLCLATTAVAEVRELSQAELRAAVAADQGIPTRTLIRGVETFTGGEVVDIRAFQSGTDLVYRILYRDGDGAIAAILVEGATGRAVGAATDIGRSITDYVMVNHGDRNGNGKALGQSNQSNGSGNANANSSAGSGNNSRGENGNRGGSGNGNRGGNGNGNGRNN